MAGPKLLTDAAIGFRIPLMTDLFAFANPSTGKWSKNTLSALRDAFAAALAAPVRSYPDITGLLANVEIQNNFFALVSDASGDPVVQSGWALYLFPGGDRAQLSTYMFIQGQFNGEAIKKTQNQVGHGFSVGDVLTLDPDYGLLVKVSDPSTEKRIGVVNSVIDANNVQYVQVGYIRGLSGLSIGELYYAQADGTLGLSPTDMPVLLADSSVSGYVLSSGASGGGNGAFNIDGGNASSVYGGIPGMDGGGA